MSFYYPQAIVSLRVLWENFGIKNEPKLSQEYILDVLAKSVTVSINDYTQADTIKAEIEYKSFPFDPRSIRALGITVHMEDTRDIFDKRGRLDLIQAKEDNIMFQGFVDESGITLSETEQTVRVEGRDFTSLLIDAQFDRPNVPLTQPLEVIIQDFISGLKATEDMTVELRIPGTTTLPTLAKLAPDFNSKLSGTRNKKKREKYWDVIQELVFRAGLIAFVELDKVVITKPRALYNKANARQFIFGRNVSTLTFNRKLGRTKGINVRVISLDLESKNVIDAKIPEEATQEFTKALGIAQERVKIQKLTSKEGKKEEEDAPFITFRVPDVNNKAHLVAVGEKVFEEIGRQQIEGTLETKEMVIRQGGTDPTKGIEFDALKIRNGTAIDVVIEKDDIEKIRRLSTPGSKAQYLRSRGYERAAAEALATSLGKITTTFYTKAVEFRIDKQDGFKMSLEFINFIEVPNRILR